jgi:hypothetical protein
VPRPFRQEPNGPAPPPAAADECRGRHLADIDEQLSGRPKNIDEKHTSRPRLKTIEEEHHRRPRPQHIEETQGWPMHIEEELTQPRPVLMTGLNRPADIDESPLGKAGPGRVYIEEMLRHRPAGRTGLGRPAVAKIEETNRPPARQAGHDEIEEDS